MSKKRMVVIVIASTLLFGAIGLVKVTYAKIPYSTPWGKMYREPEWSNAYGRSWFALCNNGTYGYLYLEPYYNYGCSASITFKKNNKIIKKASSNAYSGSCTVKANSPQADGAYFSGGGYGISFKVYVKK